MSSKQPPKKDVLELDDESVKVLKETLGLTNLQQQITAMLDARDKKLVNDIMTEIAKAKTQTPPPNTAVPAEQQQQQQTHPMAGLLGGITEAIKSAVTPPAPPDQNTQIVTQVVGLALDNLKLTNQYMTKAIFGNVEIPKQTSHVSG